MDVLGFCACSVWLLGFGAHVWVLALVMGGMRGWCLVAGETSLLGLTWSGLVWDGWGVLVREREFVGRDWFCVVGC